MRKIATMMTLIAAILGFMGGLLSFAGGVRLNQTGLRQRLRIWSVGKRLGRAYAMKNKEEIQRLGNLLQVMKLYSPKITHQATGISYFAELKNEDSFEILAGRLGNSPSLSPEIRGMLILTLKEIAPSLNVQT